MRRAAVIRRSLVAMTMIAAATSVRAQSRTLDDFERAGRWTAHPSDGTTMRIASATGHRGKGLRIDYAFSGGGYAIVRRELPLDLPANYELSFRIRGASPSQSLEVKLIDSTGDNVWWRNQRDFVFPATWRKVAIKKRHIEFAWGPLGGGELRRAAAIEIAITASSGGRGSVWIDDLVLETKPAPVRNASAPSAAASSQNQGMIAGNAVDGDSTTFWDAGSASRRWITVNLGGVREIGGLVVHWLPDAHAPDYDVQTSDDGAAWRTVYSVRVGDGDRDFIYLPETETGHVRVIDCAAGPQRRLAIREITIQPVEWSASRNAFFTAVAAAAPLGTYPKYFSGAQSYWTIVGANGDAREGLINEQALLEVDRSAFSIEPMVYAGGRLVTWADVSTTATLEEGYLPIPSVEWRAGDVGLTVTAFASGVAGKSVLWARYRMHNHGTAPATPTLYLAIRPFQVNPPAQFLNTRGGTADVSGIAWDGKTVRVRGGSGIHARRVIPVSAPAGFGATTFDRGDIVTSLRRGLLPDASTVTDHFGAASGALSYPMRLAPGASRDVWIAIPWYATAGRAMTVTTAEAALTATRREWTSTLDGVHIELPPAGARFVESIKANLAYMLITRDGAALQPGARSYKRAWIRDGALMSAGLLRLGREREAREFTEWYAGFQYPNGKVPCCVDARGADPVPENDSHGQLIYLIAEVYRFNHDRAFLERLWPHVSKAVTYIDSLRQSRMTVEYTTGDKRAYYGLVPQSISHEGYSAKPMHSYWDDAFTLRGLKDAVDVAAALGRETERIRFARIRDEFRRDMMASYRLAMAIHRIDYLPGAVELGDFDATSTTVGVAPGGELEALPHPALERTFEKYYENFRARIDSATWDAYTPYELRVVGTMVRLGWKDRAHELLDFFFRDQRPAGWRAWAEVVYRDTNATRFIGDLPHTWVGSDYIRSALDMLAYERDADSAIVVGAGIPSAWVSVSPGVIVRGLRTPSGRLDFTMRGAGDTVRVTLDAESVPAGGFVIRSPHARPLRSVALNGVALPLPAGGEIRIRDARADLVLIH